MALAKDNVAEYKRVHRWIYKHGVKTGTCEHCGSSEEKTEWSNVSGKYRYRRSDWQELCRKCHRQYDVRLAVGFDLAQIDLPDLMQAMAYEHVAFDSPYPYMPQDLAA